MSYTAEKLISIALAEEGYLEKKSNSQLDDKTANVGDNNYTKYARDLKKAGYYNNKNKNGYAWCDVFVDWCHFKAAGEDAVEAQRVTCQTGPYGAGCTYSMRYYKGAKRWFTSPLPGDQIFYGDKSTPNKSSHTGIVYKVDNKKVYTIEGNTSSAAGVVANGGAVAKKAYSLNYKRILGYGRPLYADSDNIIDYDNIGGTVEEFLPNLEAVQSTTKHNFFNIRILSVNATKASVQVLATAPNNYSWRCEVLNLINNTTKTISMSSSGLDNIVLTSLVPNTPYTLKIIAESTSMQSSQQILFITAQDAPEAISNLKMSASNGELLQMQFNVQFNSPESWGNFDTYLNKGYRVSLWIAGRQVSFSDTLITADTVNVNKKISLTDFLNVSDNLEQYIGHSVQIGIQTWVKDTNGVLILNSQGPVCSQPIYLKPFLSPVNNVYIRVLNNFKRAALWYNN